MTNHLAVLRAAALAATLAAVSAAPAAAQFEGTITMRISSTRGGGDMRYSIKGDRLRIDLTPQPAACTSLPTAAWRRW